MLLLLLAIPLLAAPFLAPRRPGSVAAQLLLTGFALAALWQGAATLDPSELRDIAVQSPGDAWFVGVSLGALLTAAVLLPAALQLRQLVIGLPLLVGVALTTTATMVVPLLVGAGVALVPFGVARVMPVRPGDHASFGTAPSDTDGEWLLALVTAIGMLFLPLVLAVTLLLMVGWQRAMRRPAWWPIVATVLATVLLVIWCWSAVTVAGSLGMSLRTFARDAPVSPAASQLLAALSLGGLLLLLRPWPLARSTAPPATLVVLALAFHLLAGAASAAGVLHWQPIVSIAMLAVFVIAAVRRDWDQLAVALLVLAATRPGAPALVAGVAAALGPAWRRRVADDRVRALGAGVVLALVTGVVVRDQVVIGVVLALVAAAVAHRVDRCVAAVAGPAHL